ncbi:uncharacterized protein A4U43_C04F12700 [Asparagus officinalis]|uniref:Uncharacterized protein n=1 Tax=Asparagus officinalis TaxID=4686 RepID=A0A5P1F329_ASPOF|nr:uncharacterized protein A4U43_C04F12700 [Asparagus officinalis]
MEERRSLFQSFICWPMMECISALSVAALAIAYSLNIGDSSVLLDDFWELLGEGDHGLFLLGLTGAWRLAWNLTCHRHKVDGDGDNDDDDSTKIWDFSVAISFSFSSFESSVYFFD